MSNSKSTTLPERYQRLIELSRDVGSTLDLNQVLDRIVNAAADLCDAQAASILLYDAGKNELYFQAATNLETPLLRGLAVPVDSSIAGWVLKQRQPVVISDAEKDPRHFNQIGQATHLHTTSLLGVPLCSRESVIGVLEAINKRQGGFSSEDQDLLMALGAQAAIAIENARLFQQSDLIAELVHELRTPLGSLNAAAHLLDRAEINTEQRLQLVKIMQGEIARLSDMASAFLDMAHLESGRSHFQIERIELLSLLHDCVAVVQSRVQERKQCLSLELPVSLPPVNGDRDKLKQVLLNLLSNATNYTPEGGSITLSACARDGEVLLCVKDTGIGIAPENLGSIFEKFYRVPSTTTPEPGTGLGLAISKRIVEAHKGRITVQSQEGVGTLFTVHLPVAQDSTTP